MNKKQQRKFGRNIRDIRTIRKVSLNNLAREAGISPTHLSEVERGESDPRMGTVLQLAHLLKCSVNGFLDFD